MAQGSPAGSAPPAEDADIETSSEAYARRFAGPVGAWFLEVQAATTLELLAPWPAAAVLDVGGGHGQTTGPLVEAGHRVTIYGSAERCGERVGEWVGAGRARFEWGDLLRLPWQDHAFDVVLSYRLLPHVARWGVLVAELLRVARHAVIVDYPTLRSVNALSAGLFGLKKGVEGDTRPFTVFRDGEIQGALAQAGFRVTARRAQFFFPMALHRAMGRVPSSGRAIAFSRALETAARALGLTRVLGSPVILRAEPRG